MLRKLFAKLRGKPAPSAPTSKPAGDAGKPSTHPAADKHQARSEPRRERGPRPAGEGDRGQGRQGDKGGQGRGRNRDQPRHDGAPRQDRPAAARDDRPAAARSDRPASSSRGERPLSRGGRRGFDDRRDGKPARQERPKRDDTFEHPRSEPIKPVTPINVPPQDTAFSKLGLNDAIAYSVAEKGYNDPTPIQAQAIPVVLAGKDVIGSAQTGTGKTAAFALPILHRLGAHGKMRCLVLEPTRELALQVEEAFQKYSKHTDLTTTIVYGGVGYGKQREDLKRGVDILAATPGRLLDLLQDGTTHLRDIEILVLDEVDRMLDMGFLPDVKRIVQQCPSARQTLFFTATMPPELASLAGWALHEPVEIKIGQRRSPAETIAHAFYPVVASQKFDLLIELLRRTDFKSVLIFTRTRMGADRIASRLEREKHTVGVLHSDRNQRERVEALQGFKDGRFEVLVATDIAARGLDIAGVSHVVNYDVPENPEDYVHRIGRTGRALNTGDAFTLVTEDDVRDARSIERFINTTIERKKIEDFPYIYSALFDETVQAAAIPTKTTSRLMRGMRR